MWIVLVFTVAVMIVGLVLVWTGANSHAKWTGALFGEMRRSINRRR